MILNNWDDVDDMPYHPLNTNITIHGETINPTGLYATIVTVNKKLHARVPFKYPIDLDAIYAIIREEQTP